MNKTFISLFFLTAITHGSITYSMEKPQDSIKVSTASKSCLFHKRKKMNITNQDISQSLCLNTRHETVQTSLWKTIPFKISHKEKDIKEFTDILHKPALYDELLGKEYSDALAIAEKFKAPLLYADLLGEKLPESIMSLIKQKYLYLYLKNKIHLKIPNIIDFNQRKKPNLKYDCLHNVKNTLYDLIKTATLTQTVMLTLMCNRSTFSQKKTIITPHMAGFNALKLWDEKKLAFICANLSAKIKTEEVYNKYFIQSFSFNI